MNYELFQDLFQHCRFYLTTIFRIFSNNFLLLVPLTHWRPWILLTMKSCCRQVLAKSHWIDCSRVHSISAECSWWLCNFVGVLFVVFHRVLFWSLLQYIVCSWFGCTNCRILPAFASFCWWHADLWHLFVITLWWILVSSFWVCGWQSLLDVLDVLEPYCYLITVYSVLNLVFYAHKASQDSLPVLLQIMQSYGYK